MHVRPNRPARHRLPFWTALAVAALSAGAAGAVPASDPAGDFLAGYTGPRDAELDVLRVDFTYDGGTFTLSSTEAGPISASSGALFVWGVDRGAGGQGFPIIAPGVLFDAVVVVNPTAGTTTVRDLTSGSATTLDASSFRVAGDDLTVDVPADLLPSRGFLPAAYTANLWPRSGAGGDPVISDFAPDDGNIAVTVLPAAVPEPVSVILVASGLVGMAAFRRRRTASGMA